MQTAVPFSQEDQRAGDAQREQPVGKDFQSWGNEFTSGGVQQLVALQNLEYLYLEEETLEYSAFDFVGRLPRLRRLGLKDVPLSENDLARLTDRLPDVDVG